MGLPRIVVGETPARGVGRYSAMASRLWQQTEMGKLPHPFRLLLSLSVSLSRSLKTVLRCSPSADASGEFRPSARRGAGRVERPEAAARARRFATDGRLLRARGEADSARLRARDAGAGNGLTRGAPADLRQRTTGLRPPFAEALPEAPGIPHLSQFTAALAEETG